MHLNEKNIISGLIGGFVIIFSFVLFIWIMMPMIGPIIGTRRTSDNMVEWIKRRNIILLVDPILVIKRQKGSYQDWALAELNKRFKASAALWGISIVSLVFLVIKQNKKKKSITNGVI